MERIKYKLILFCFLLPSSLLAHEISLITCENEFTSNYLEDSVTKASFNFAITIYTKDKMVKYVNRLGEMSESKYEETTGNEILWFTDYGLELNSKIVKREAITINRFSGEYMQFIEVYRFSDGLTQEESDNLINSIGIRDNQFLELIHQGKCKAVNSLF